jgi:hypothetical protein
LDKKNGKEIKPTQRKKEKKQQSSKKKKKNAASRSGDGGAHCGRLLRVGKHQNLGRLKQRLG